MSRRRCLIWAAALLGLGVIVAWAPAACAATGAPAGPALSPAAAIAQAGALDGRTVTVAGEAVGDVMFRDRWAWVTIGDEGVALGVWLSAEQASRVARVGGYASRGDRVAVTGVLHRACPQHGGDLDLHADRLEVVARGGPLSHPVDRLRLLRGAMLLAAGLAAAAAVVLPGLPAGRRRSRRAAGIAR